MNEFRHETIIINKETWKFLWNYERKIGGCSELTDESLEIVWGYYVNRNHGANSKTYLIAEDEVRIHKDTFGIPLNTIKALIIDNGFSYREDEFIVKGLRA